MRLTGNDMKLFDSVLAGVKKEYALFTSLNTNAIIRWSGRMTVVLILASLAVLLISYNSLPAQVPLWYSKPWGTDRLAEPLWLFLLPGASCIWHIINSFLSIHITKEHLVFSQILFLSSLLGRIFSFVTLTMIIWVIS